MLRESQEALRLRDLFNSIASHELKTPLTALMLNLRLLRNRLDKEVPDNATLRAQVKRCDSAASGWASSFTPCSTWRRSTTASSGSPCTRWTSVDAVRRIGERLRDQRNGPSPADSACRPRGRDGARSIRCGSTRW